MKLHIPAKNRRLLHEYNEKCIELEAIVSGFSETKATSCPEGIQPTILLTNVKMRDRRYACKHIWLICKNINELKQGNVIRFKGTVYEYLQENIRKVRNNYSLTNIDLLQVDNVAVA